MADTVTEDEQRRQQNAEGEAVLPAPACGHPILLDIMAQRLEAAEQDEPSAGNTHTDTAQIINSLTKADICKEDNAVGEGDVGKASCEPGLSSPPHSHSEIG